MTVKLGSKMQSMMTPIIAKSRDGVENEPLSAENNNVHSIFSEKMDHASSSIVLLLFLTNVMHSD
jgi:hypothetical protein